MPTATADRVDVAGVPAEVFVRSLTAVQKAAVLRGLLAEVVPADNAGNPVPMTGPDGAELGHFLPRWKGRQVTVPMLTAEQQADIDAALLEKSEPFDINEFIAYVKQSRGRG